MKKKLLVIISYVAILILIISISVIQMTKSKLCELRFNVETSDNNIQIDLIIKNVKKISTPDIHLILNQITPIDLTCTNDKGTLLSYKKVGNELIIFGNKASSINIKYQIKLGSLGKHGHQGIQVNDKLVAFEGSQVFILPIQTQQQDTNIFGQLKVDYKIQELKDKIVPFQNGDSSYIKSPNWSDYYSFMKASFVFGKLININPENKSYTLVTNKAPKLLEKKMTQFTSLVNYYIKLFGYKPENLSLILLDKYKDEKGIIAGAGANTICASFDPDKIRDWQLLSHRLFHVFFDGTVKSQNYHTPPNLWLYEGLATYYETKSTSELFNRGKNQDFLNIYKSYIYSYFHNPSLFALSPMDEKTIAKSNGLTEFLHYTQAPLVVKYIEDINHAEDSILKFIIENKSNINIEVLDIIENTLSSQASTFEDNYLYGANVLPLWYLSSDIKENTQDVIRQINESNYSLWTWLRPEMELEKYSKDDLDKRETKSFADKKTEDAVKHLSPVIYKLLKIN